MDETMKKGEVHISVVATGFDADKVSESPMEKMSRLTIEDARKKEPEVEEKPRMTYPEKMEANMIISEKVPPKPQRNISIARDSIRDLDEQDDDELEIPAFIRRKIGK